jgi:hypothetical protein
MIAFRDEQIRSQQPGYVCTYDDYGEDSFAELSEFELPVEARSVAAGATRRIESGNGAINAPHIAPAGEPRSPQRVNAGRAHGPETDDEFGEGLA